MPGILGISKASSSTWKEVLSTGGNMLCYGPWHENKGIFQDRQIACTFIHSLSKYESKKDIHCWIDGEFFQEGVSLPEAYVKERLEPTLAGIDGCFSATLYDASKGQLLFISDRLGLQPLYIWEEHGRLGWCSELKGLLAVDTFSPRMDREAMHCFLDLGYIAGDRTWFEQVLRMPASSVWIYDLKQGRFISKKRYWHWSRIQKQSIPFREAEDMLGPLIRDAVERRSRNTDGLGLSLSGGLDSRTILAYLPQKIPTFTFGRKGSWDVEIARKVAERLGTDHHFFELNERNWLDKRLEGVWRSDGFKNLIHLHFSGQQEAIQKVCTTNLNGFLGGVALGGIYAGRKGSGSSLGPYAHFDDPKDPFYDFPAADPYLINNRIRRFSMGGVIEWSKWTVQRKPFTDNRLLEFLYGLPDEYRRNSRLFNSVLLKEHPALFVDIPWQRTGLPISRKWATRWVLNFKIREVQRRLGGLSEYSFTNYPHWLRSGKGPSLFLDLLDPAKSVYPDYIDLDFLKLYWPPSSGRVEMIGRAATLEYWLRRVFT